MVLHRALALVIDLSWLAIYIVESLLFGLKSVSKIQKMSAFTALITSFRSTLFSNVQPLKVHVES